MHCCRRLEVNPACKNAHEHQGKDDLYEYDGHQEHWTPGNEGLGAGDGRRQEGQVSQIADDDESEQTSSRDVDS
jgi:hypothetical protein